MEKRFRPLIVAIGALCACVACAELAGIEDPKPSAVAIVADGGIEVPPDDLHPVGACDGTEAQQANLRLLNDGPSAQTYVASIQPTDSFTLTNAQGTIGSGSEAHVYIQAKGTQPGTLNGQLQVVIDGGAGGSRTVVVNVVATINGGQLSVIPPRFDFGDVKAGTVSQAQTIDIRNLGTVPIEVLSFDPVGFAGDGGTPPFTITPPSGPIAAGATAQATVTFMAPGPSDTPIVAVYAPRLAKVACGAEQVTLQGRPVDTDVTADPGTVEFGEVDCDYDGGTIKPITITNYSANQVSFAAITADDSWVKVAPTNGVVAAGAGDKVHGKTVDLTVTLTKVGPIDANLHSDKISIVVTRSGLPDITSTVTATAKSVGARLEFTPSQVTFNGVSQQGQSQWITVKNTGTNGVNAHIALASTDNFAFAFGEGSHFLQPNTLLSSSTTVGVAFTANTGAPFDTALQTTRDPAANGVFGRSYPICPPPADVPLHGNP